MRLAAPLLALLVATSLGGCGDLDEHGGVVCEALGGEGCPCLPGGACVAPEIDGPTLTCLEGLCVAAACEPGTQGCPCAAGRLCDPVGPDGPLLCVEGACAAQDCAAGERGCDCSSTAPCAPDLVCDDGRCADDSGQTLEVPGDPRCFTPCRGGGLTTPDGGYRACDDDGLLPGCVDDAVCVQGSCVRPSAGDAGQVELPGCGGDYDCPTFQVCIDGRCYSDCDSDSDCRAGRRCFAKACRAPCAPGGDDACPAGSRCHSDDGLTGACLPMRPRDSATARTLSGLGESGPGALAVTVSRDLLSITPATETASFTVTNDAPTSATVTVAKTDHWAMTAEGPRTETTAPMDWVGISVDGGAPVQDLSVTIDLPAGGEALVTLTGLQDTNYGRWRGSLTVSAPGASSQSVRVGFADSPAGRWVGQAYLYADWGSENLEDWATAARGGDTATADDTVDLVDNALVRRWWGFRQGSVTAEKLLSALVATETESWAWPTVQDLCPEGKICHPYDNVDGYLVYSDDAAANPVPRGLTRFDMAIHVRPEDDDPLQWTGRIESGVALQYPGRPALSLTFGSDPTDCYWIDGPCRAPLTAFDATMAVGGRRPVDHDDDSCELSPADSQTRVSRDRIPWLPPGFAGGVELEAAADGQRYRHECRDRGLPAGNVDDEHDSNIAWTSANPFPDGTTLRPVLRLIDGVLLDADNMLILFEQTLPSLFPGTSAATSGYGYMRLKRAAEELEADEYGGATAASANLDPTPTAPAVCAEWIRERVWGAAPPTLSAADRAQRRTLRPRWSMGGRPAPP